MKLERNKKYLVFLVLLTIICAVIGFFTINKNNTVFAAEVIVNDWKQEQGAFLGDILEVPSNVKLKIDNGTTIDAEEGVLYFPDGNARTLAPKRLDMVGKYILQYQSTVNGKIYKGEKSFVVSDSNYYLSNNLVSSANFVKAEELKYGKNLIKEEATDGIEVLLAEGDYFRFNKPINIYDVADSEGMVDVSWVYPVMDSSLTSNEVDVDSEGNPIYKKDGEGNLLLDGEGNPIPNGQYGKNLHIYFSIKLIDCYDESNYVEFYMNTWQEGRVQKHTGCAVGAAGQLCSSITAGNDASATVEIGEKKYKPRYYNRYSFADYWLYGNTYTLFSGPKKVFSMNVNTNEIYFNNNIVTDLDHPQIYKDNPFKGFTTGEVYVQYSFNDYRTSDSAYLYIKEILGLSGEQLKKDIVSDNECPDVDIDIQYTDIEEKSINVMYNQEYELPKAKVYDVNGDDSYKLAVYYDYHTDNPKSVNVQNGKFIPDKLGVVYTAVYLVEDDFGNKNLDNNGKCIDYINLLPVVGKGINYSEEKIEELISCKENLLPNIDVVSLNKDVHTKVFVIEPNGRKIEITDTYNGENFVFVPEFIGEYTIEYHFEDNVYSKVFRYKINSKDEGDVLFLEKIALPSILIKDAIYDIDDYFAYVATSNGISKNIATLFASVDGGDFYEIDDQHRFNVSGTQSISFKAKYLDKETAIQSCKIVDVNFAQNENVNDGDKIYENYFDGFDSINATDSYIEYKFNADKLAQLQYATPLVYDDFSIEFEIPTETAASCDKIDIILKEICGTEKGAIISYIKLMESNRFYYTITDLKGENTYFASIVNGSFVGTHSLTVTNSKLVSGEGAIASIPSVDSRNVELSILIYSETATALRIRSLCGNAFSASIYEKPAALIYKRPVGGIEVGAEYVIPTFNVSSIFYPISLANLKYTFKDAQGNILVDKNGNKVENVLGNTSAITIIPKDVNIYFFDFSYDNYGKRLNVLDPGYYMISVSDTIPPTTVFVDGSNSETTVNVKVGDTHTIKAFKVNDNSTEKENLNVKVVILDEYSAVIGWNVGDSFKFAKTGKYKVVVFAQDAERNTSTSFYNVLVR